MKPLVILACVALTGCGTTLTMQNATKTEGDLIIAQMAAQSSFNAAKPHLTTSQIAQGQRALDEWLAALEAADKARLAADTSIEASQLAAAAQAQTVASKIIPGN